MACLQQWRESACWFDPIQRGRHALANGDSPGGNPLAGIKQVHYRVVPTRGKVTSTRVERSGDAATHVGSEVFAQRKGGNVNDPDGVLRRVGEDHAVTRMIEHRSRCCQLPKHQLLRDHTRGDGWKRAKKYSSTIHGRPLCLGRGVVGILPVGHEGKMVRG